MNRLKLAILALAAVLIATSLIDTGFGSPSHPLGSLLRRAETVLVVRMTSHTETNAVFEVAHVLRGDATLQQLALGHTRAGHKLPKNTQSFFLFSQGDNCWGPPKDSFQVGQPIKGQASYRGWILTDGPGEGKEELERLRELVKENPYKPDLHGRLSARILLPAEIKPDDGAHPAKLELTNTGEGPVRVLTRCYPTASTFTGWLSVRFRPQSEQHTPRIAELAKSVVELSPGESTTLPFEFTDPGNKMPQVTASYEVPEALAEKLNVWFGVVKAKRIVFTRTDGGVLRVVPPEQLPLCGSRLSIEEALKQEFAFVAACETLESVMKEANLGRSNWIQEFWPLEVLGGNEPGVCVFHLDYRFCDVPDRRERGVGKGERVIWIVRRDSNRLPPWEGVKALIDTPENRAAVLAALPKEQSERAATLEDVSQRVRTQAATATGRIGAAEEDGKAAPLQFGAGGTARLTPTQRRIADEVVGDVIAKIQARIAQRQRLAESIAELAKREKSQLGGTSAGDVAICAYSCRQRRVPVPEALNEKVVDDIIFQYRNPPEGSWSDTYPHQKACVWALGELGHCKAVPVIMECLADEEKPYGAAWDALRHVSDEALIPVIARQMDIKPRLSAYPATGGLGRLGRPALPLLKRILEAPDPQGKEGAIHALVEICLPECLPPLERLAESGELKGDSARRKLATAIATIRCRAVDKTYVPPKWSYEDRCRMHHLVALALSIEHQVKGSEDLADEAEAALIEIGPSMAAAAVRPQLSSRTHTDVGGGGDYWLSRKAAALMVRFGEPAIPALLDALNDDFDTARGNASRALKRITGEDFGTDYSAWREWCLKTGKLKPSPSTGAAKPPRESKEKRKRR